MIIPCSDWISTDDLIECDCPNNATETQVTQAIEAASQWMFNQLGRRWSGTCSTTERPCGCGCCGGWMFDGPVGNWQAWADYYGGCGCTSGLCGCASLSVVETTYGPIIGTPTVTIDGAAFTDFVVVPPNRLVRTDGGTWPSCQSYESGTGWTVAYQHGEAPPELAKLATADLAAEIIRQCTNDTHCALPAGTTNVTRRGVTVNLEPDHAGVALPRVALALNAWPKRSAQPDVRVPGSRATVTAGPS